MANHLPWRVLCCLLAASSGALAQREPHIGYAYPAGGQRGTEILVTVGGQSLSMVTGAIVSGSGVRAELVSYARPLTQKELTDLREKAADLQRRRDAKASFTADDEKLLLEIRSKLAERARRDATPALAETALVRVTIARECEPSPRELRLVMREGLTNALNFCVGELPEVRTPDKGGPAETRVEQGVLVNGQILPGEVDRLRFVAVKGQHLVAITSARALIPYLADAVPGWFQAILLLRDAKGKELACVDDYRFDPDPVLHFQIPADGEYVLEIRDALYRGREDFVYRVAFGELPFVTSVFPLGATAGAPTTLALRGWNLPEKEVKLTDGAATRVQVRTALMTSNPLPFARDTLLECLEQEPNDATATAQSLALGCIVNGKLEQSGDVDVFRFEAAAGEKIVAEVMARRLGSPVDAALRLVDAAGKKIAFADDCEDKAEGESTHHADPKLAAEIPATGTYFLHLREAQGHGGPEFGYRLRLSAPRPDFRLRVVPSCIQLRPGTTVAFTVHALRLDGFAGEILLALRDAPDGARFGGARIPPGEDRVRVTLALPGPARAEPLPLHLEGRARLGDRELVHEGVPADDRMQAFFYHHLVPAKDLLVCVGGAPGPAFAAHFATTAPLAIPRGGTARVDVNFARAGNRGRGGFAAFDSLAFELDDPPAGISLQSFARKGDGFELVLAADAVAARIGSAGNLIVQVVAAEPPSTQPRAVARQGQRRRILGLLPALPFAVLARKGENDGGF